MAIIEKPLWTGFLLLATLVGRPAFSLDYQLEARAIRAGAVSLDALTIERDDQLQITASNLAVDSLAALGTWRLDCNAGADPCRRGSLNWTHPDGEVVALSYTRNNGEFRLIHDQSFARARFSLRQNPRLKLAALPLAWTPAELLARAGLSHLTGTLALQARLDPGASQVELTISELAFDTPDGSQAGAGLELEATLDWRRPEQELRLEGAWTRGELLLGPLYLPAPESPWAFHLVGRQQDSKWLLDSLQLRRKGTLSLIGQARVDPALAGWIERAEVELLEADLGALWRAGGQSLAASAGLAWLEPSGHLRGSLAWRDAAIEALALRLDQAALIDDAGRLRIDGARATLDWRADSDSLDFEAGWQDAALHRIPLGASRLALTSDDRGALRLQAPLRLPVLDGALVVHELVWRDWRGAAPELNLRAELEPIDLGRLTTILGWTQFGGRISGQLPGLRATENGFEFDGGLDLALFGGRARVNRLSLERPFGTLPALAADLEFERLDLEPLTGAFEFGFMRGLLSGHVRGLRLLDWQPVAFDAWFHTLEESPKRVISQKAVDTLTRVSGGGGAAVSSALLGLFDRFPYRRFGLGCRLSANVCEMRGLGPADGEGYLILEGRGLPHLDIVAYRKRVDWPRLLSQVNEALKRTE